HSALDQRARETSFEVGLAAVGVELLVGLTDRGVGYRRHVTQTLDFCGRLDGAECPHDRRGVDELRIRKELAQAEVARGWHRGQFERDSSIAKTAVAQR